MGRSSTVTHGSKNPLINLVNRAWILEVARSSKPNSIELDGFDITSSNFPAAGWLPPNIRLHVWDAFTDVPDQYVDVFDVVHIRAMYSSVVDNKVDPLLSNLLKMLKPGGFLQWDESDASTIQCQVPNPEVKADAARTLVTLQQVFSRGQSRLVPDWIHNLPSTLEGRKCEMVANEEFQPRPELARAWTDNMLLVWRGLIPMIPEASVPLPPGMGSPESISRQSYAELLQKAVEETSKGAAINMIYHVFVARKKA